MSNAKVELFDVALKGCSSFALCIPHTTSATTTLVATRCEFANSFWGAVVQGSLISVIDFNRQRLETSRASEDGGVV